MISISQNGSVVEEKLGEVERRPRVRKDIIHGSTRKIRTGCGNIYVTVNEDGERHLFEIFNHIGKAGGCAASQSEAIGRLVSLALRSGIEPEDVVRQLKGISCHMPVWHQEGKILSCADAIAKAIEWHLQDKKRVEVEGERKDDVIRNNTKEEGGLILPILQASQNKSIPIFVRGACPECGGPLLFEEGCMKCLCGYSDCG
jgi:ribonucleoside-diphosphate reductase alpha chain